MTIEDEKKIGAEFYDNLVKNKAIYHNAQVEDYVSKVGMRLVAIIPKSPFEYHFSIIKSSAINAFATPGGYVYVNMGLISLAENESELAGVLAHEIGHVSGHHVADIVDKSTKVSIASLAAILAGAFLGRGGDLTAATASFSMAAATSLNLKYSREHEEEADRTGLSYLVKAGYNGRSMLDFLKIMRQYEYYSSSVPSYFLTHPGTDERIRYLDALLQTRYQPGGSESLVGQFKRVQTILKLASKDLDASLKYFQTALAKNNQDIDSLYGLAVTQGRLGLTAQALDNFKKALIIAPNDRDILRDAGIAYLNSGHVEEAVFYLRKVGEQAGDSDQTALANLGKAYVTLGDYTAAIDIYKQLEKKNPQDVEVLYNLAFAYGKMNNQGESHYYFGVYFMKKAKPESALFHFKEALTYFPPDSPRAKDITNRMNAQKSPRSTKEKKQPESRRPPLGINESQDYRFGEATIPSWHTQGRFFP